MSEAAALLMVLGIAAVFAAGFAFGWWCDQRSRRRHGMPYETVEQLARRWMEHAGQRGPGG